MRLLLVSHSYVLANARGKVRALSRLARLTLLVPRRWPFEMLAAVVEPETEPTVELVSSRVLLPGHNIRYVYAPGVVWATLGRARPDVVLVEEESASLALAQFSLLKRRFGYRLYFFLWENILGSPSWRPASSASTCQQPMPPLRAAGARFRSCGKRVSRGRLRLSRRWASTRQCLRPTLPRRRVAQRRRGSSPHS